MSATKEQIDRLKYMATGRADILLTDAHAIHALLTDFEAVCKRLEQRERDFEQLIAAEKRNK